MSRFAVRLSWSLRIVAAIILLQTLYFKFSAAPESVYIFTKLGIEPWGRIASAVAELISGILLLIPRTAWMGAALGAAVMCGALVSHFTELGLVVMNDGGLLFIMAVVTMGCCVGILYLHREEIPLIKSPIY